MCISAAEAHFSNTKLYVGEITKRKSGPIIHVAGYRAVYRNSVDNRSFTLSRRPVPTTGNAILLVVPAKPGTMGRENFIDTSDCPKILDDMERAIAPRRMSLGGASRGLPLADGARVFNVGAWTVVLATDSRFISDVLDQVPEDRRPPEGSKAYSGISDYYPGFTVVLGCFNNAEPKDSGPLFYWYEPMREDVLFAPAFDSHDGGDFRLSSKVAVDHTVIFGSDRFEKGAGQRVNYMGEISDDVRGFLPDEVVGEKFFNKYLPNGDFIASTLAVRQGRPEYMRQLPPNC